VCEADVSLSLCKERSTSVLATKQNSFEQHRSIALAGRTRNKMCYLSVSHGALRLVAYFPFKARPYSITESRVPELIPVLGSQPAGDVSHKPGGRLPLLSARPAVTPATLKRAATDFAAW